MSLTRASTRSGTVAVPQAQRRPLRFGYWLASATVWAFCAAVAWWWYRRYLPQFRPEQVAASTPWGRWFGVIGLLLFVILALYGIRRIQYRHRLVALTWWYRAHLLLGLLALTLLACHSGFAFRSAFMAALQTGFWGTVATGILGWATATLVRGWLRTHEYRPAVWSELAAERTRLRAELLAPPVEKDSGKGAKDPGAESAPLTPAEAAGPGPGVRRALARLAARRRARLWVFADWNSWEREVERAASDLPGDLRRRLVELNRVEVLLAYHGALRGWISLHLFFVAATLVLIATHVYVVAGY